MSGQASFEDVVDVLPRIAAEIRQHGILRILSIRASTDNTRAAWADVTVSSHDDQRLLDAYQWEPVDDCSRYGCDVWVTATLCGVPVRTFFRTSLLKEATA